MQCHTPYIAIKAGTTLRTEEHPKGRYYENDIAVPCGNCPACKLRRVSDWCIRLAEEDKVSSSAFFVTLTYDTNHVPISPKGYMTLNKRDVQLWMKRLRKKSNNKLRYYLAGEYGEQKYRPHYHVILFNLEDKEYIYDTWKLGNVHVGDVSTNSIAYTAKYIDKEKRIPLHQNDDRLKEFSHMSTGVGKSYLYKTVNGKEIPKHEIFNYHKADIENNYITSNGYKKPLPRYYRKKIYTEQELRDQVDLIHTRKRDSRKEKMDKVKRLYKGKVTILEYEDLEKRGEYNKFYNSSKKKRQ